MAKERRSSETKLKKENADNRQRNDSPEDSEPISYVEKKRLAQHKSPKKQVTWSPQKNVDPDVSVQLRNADMFSKYRVKNPHIQIDRPNSTTTNFTPNQLSEDDEIWFFEVPNDINVNDFVGQNFKLGSKSSTMQTENFAVECVTEKYNEPKTEVMICQNKNSQLVAKTFTPAGRVLMRKHIDDTPDVPLDTNAISCRTKVPYPAHLKARHPIHGANFESSIKIEDRIRRKLENAENCSTNKLKKRVKHEIEAGDSPLKRRKRNDTEHEDVLDSKNLFIKKENNNDNEELAWLSQI